MQNGSEQVCNDEIGELSERVGDEIEFDVGALACEDAVDLVLRDDTEMLMQNGSEQVCND